MGKPTSFECLDAFRLVKIQDNPSVFKCCDCEDDHLQFLGDGSYNLDSSPNKSRSPYMSIITFNHNQSQGGKVVN